jgi:hypothetical protein
MNTGDAELISQTIDEVFEPDVKQHTPFEATGTQMIKEMVIARSTGPSPTFTSRSRI